LLGAWFRMMREAIRRAVTAAEHDQVVRFGRLSESSTWETAKALHDGLLESYPIRVDAGFEGNPGVEGGAWDVKRQIICSRRETQMHEAVIAAVACDIRNWIVSLSAGREKGSASSIQARRRNRYGKRITFRASMGPRLMSRGGGNSD